MFNLPHALFTLKLNLPTGYYLVIRNTPNLVFQIAKALNLHIQQTVVYILVLCEKGIRLLHFNELVFLARVFIWVHLQGQCLITLFYFGQG
jgi:hypothetical protein